LPVLDGLAAAKEVNHHRPAPVILLTGRHDAELLAWAADSPVVKFLTRPVKEDELRAAFERVVSSAV
jgi:CheY-like chemotaxis protein